jgi:hypothetical protein
MWSCKKCRERIEASFAVCWNCGTSKDGIEDPSFQRAGAEEETGIVTDLPAQSQPAEREPQRPPLSECPRCGARKVIPGVRVLDRDGDYGAKNLSVRLDRNPAALIFKGSEIVDLRANVCGLCGYAELYATNPAALWAAHEERAAPPEEER